MCSGTCICCTKRRFWLDKMAFPISIILKRKLAQRRGLYCWINGGLLSCWEGYCYWYSSVCSRWSKSIFFQYIMHMVWCTVFISILISITITYGSTYVLPIVDRVHDSDNRCLLWYLPQCTIYVYDTSLLYFYSFSHSHSNGSSMYTTRYLEQTKYLCIY